MTATSPITGEQLKQWGVTYVDDADLMVYESRDLEAEYIRKEAQETLSAWGWGLIATGGILKPEKCHYSMWGFECHEGEWSQVDEVEHLGLAVPLANGTFQTIKQVPIQTSKKTLGIHSNAAGRYQDQVNVWIDTVQTWTGRLERGRLPTKWA